jgi:hypothetical protein
MIHLFRVIPLSAFARVTLACITIVPTTRPKAGFMKQNLAKPNKAEIQFFKPSNAGFTVLWPDSDYTLKVNRKLMKII